MKIVNRLINKLSQITIDTVKNWGGYRISSIGAPSASGDALIKGTRVTMTEMPDGTSGQVLTAQGAGANPVYATPAGTKIAAGSFTGDGTQVDRQIAVGFLCRFVYVRKRSTTIGGWIAISHAYICCLGLTVGGYTINNNVSLYLHGSDGFVVNLYQAAGIDLNVSGAVYDYVVIG